MNLYMEIISLEDDVDLLEQHVSEKGIDPEFLNIVFEDYKEKKEKTYWRGVNIKDLKVDDTIKGQHSYSTDRETAESFIIEEGALLKLTCANLISIEKVFNILITKAYILLEIAEGEDFDVLNQSIIPTLKKIEDLIKTEKEYFYPEGALKVINIENNVVEVKEIDSYLA